MEEEIFVADLPVITQEQIQAKSECIIDDGIKYSTDSSNPHPVDSSRSNSCTQQEVNNSIEDEAVQEGYKKNSSIDVVKKKVHKKRLSPHDTIALQPKFVCNICNAGFQRGNNYTIHMRKIHKIAGDPTPHACPNCPRKYEYEYELKRHMKKYEPLEDRLIFPCTQCERKFLTRVHMNRHIKYVHENTRSFICEACGEALHTSSILKEHMLTHTNYAPFQCMECSASFKQKQRLKRHMEIHGTKFECILCGMKLSSSATLRKHLLVHIEGRPHKCEYCGRAFKLMKTMQVHLNTHTGNKIYECEFCDKIYTSNSSRLKHKKKKHAEECIEEKLVKTAKYLPPTLNKIKTL